MRTLVRIVVIISAFLFPLMTWGQEKEAAPVKAAVAGKNPGDPAKKQLEDPVRKQIKDYMENPTATTECLERYVLTLDHQRQKWDFWKATCKAVNEKDEWSIEANKPEFELQLNNIPRLRLNEKDKLTVLVINTNPLIYSVTRKATTVADNPDLARVQELAALLGGFMQGVVQISTIKDQRNIKIMRRLSDPNDAIGFLLDTTHERAAAYQKAAGELGESNSGVVSMLDLLASSVSELFALTQKVELGVAETPSFKVVVPKDKPDYGEETSKSEANHTRVLEYATGKFTALSKAQKEAATKTLPYSNTYLKLAQTIEVLLGFEGPTLTEVQRAKLRDAIAAFAQEFTANGPLSGDEARAMKTIKDSLTALTEAPSKIKDKDKDKDKEKVGPPDWPPQGRRPWEELRIQASAYSRIAQIRDDAITSCRELLKKQDDATKAAASIDAGVIAVKKYSPVLNASDAVTKPNWAKIETHKFDVQASGWRAADFVKTHPTLQDITYEVTGEKFWGFSLGFGLVGTKAVNPTWKAVQSPLNKDEKVIARTKETSLAARPTVLATIHMFGSKEMKFSPGLEVGAGTDKANPSMFIGLSAGLGRWVRFGVGEGFFLVDSLAKGQKEMPKHGGTINANELTVVSSSDDIRTRQRVLRMPYISLVITIDSLEFFKPKDSSGK